MYQIWGPGNKNQLIEKQLAICVISKIPSHLLLTSTIVVDQIIMDAELIAIDELQIRV